MDTQDMNRLTNDIDSYSYEFKDKITPGELHVKLWTSLDRLRNDPNKNNLIENWKYKNEFITTEVSHANGLQTCDLLTWEQSFVLNIWISIYH